MLLRREKVVCNQMVQLSKYLFSDGFVVIKYPLINYFAEYQEIEKEEEMVSENETLNSGEDLKVTKESNKPKSMPFDMKNEENEVENGLNELDDRPTW